MISADRLQNHLRVVIVGLMSLMASRLLAQAPYALPYTINTVAGGGTVCVGAADSVGDGCPAKQAVFSTVLLGMAVDAQGNLFIADTTNNLIRRVDANTGVITVFAGSASTAVCAATMDRYGDGCPANDGLANAGGKYTSLGKPIAVAVAKNGDVYFTGGTSIVQKVSAATGIMSLVAGYVTPAGKSGAAVSGYTGDGGPATSAKVNVPRGVAVDAANDVFIADYSNNIVRVVYGGGAVAAAQITAANPMVTSPVVGNIYTICGSPGVAGITGDTGPASAALLTTPADVAVDGYGNVYIADQSKEVRMIYAGGNVMGIASPVVGNIYRVAGGGTVKGNTLNAVLGTNVTMSTVRRMAIDARGNLYISDSNEIIWFEDATTGWMRPIAGVYKGSTLPLGCPQQTDTIGNGCPATTAQIHVGVEGYGIAVDANGNLYVGDASAFTVRKVSSNLMFPATAMAETQSIALHYPVGAGQSTLVPGNADYVAGTAACTLNGDNTQDCVTPFTLMPTVPGVDNVAVASTDTLGHTGSIGLAGAGIVPAFALDPGGATMFATGLNKPASVVSDGNGNLLIADTANHRVVKYNIAAKTQKVVAGTGTSGYTGDGGMATVATLKSPGAVAVAADGTVYIADTGNNVLRRVDAVTGFISTYAGGASAVCASAVNAVGDGCAGTQAMFASPSGLAVSATGLLFVADTGSNRVRIVPQNGAAVTTAVGAGTVCAAASDAVGDGCGALQATLAGPTQIRFDAAGNLYIADTGNNLVRRVSMTTSGQPITAIAGNGQMGGGGDGGAATSAQLNEPTGIAVDGAGSIYIADVGNHAVRFVSASTNVISTVAGFNGTAGVGTLPGVATATLLTSPTGVEVVGAGAMYVLDTGNSRALAIDRDSLAFDFGKVNVTQSSAVQPVTITSSGSVAASLGSPLVTASGTTSEFAFVPVTTNGCSASQVMAPGEQCPLTAQFTPTINGSHSATYSFTGSTGENPTVPSVTLSGTAGTLVSTTSVAVQTTPATGNPQYGQTIVVTVTVTPASQGTSAIGGKVTVQVDGVAQAPVNVTANPAGDGIAAITLTKLGVGVHLIAATYSGDDVYGGSTVQTANITVEKSQSSVTLAATPTATIQFQSVTFTATVLAVAGGVPTGSVTFVSGTNVLGTGNVNVTGVATLTTTALAVGGYQVMAQYGGDGNFATASSMTLPFVVSPDPPDYTLSSTTTTLTVAQGGVIQMNLTITPTNTLNGNVKLSCSGLPANAYCTFLPQTLSFTPTTDMMTSAQVTLWTNIGPGTVPVQASVRGHGEAMWFALLGPVGLLILRRKKISRWIALSVLLTGASAAFTGCSTNLPPPTAVTPAGTSTVMVLASGPDGQSHSLPITFNVVSAQ